MQRVIWSVLLMAACTFDVGDECVAHDDCLPLGSDLFCFDNLCVIDPPIFDGGVRDIDEGVVQPPGADPLLVSCGAVEGGVIDIQPVDQDAWRVRGTTGATRLVTSSCGGAGDDGAFALRVETPGIYTLATTAEMPWRAALSIREQCVEPSSERACGASAFAGPSVVVFETRAVDERVYVLIDAEDAGGDFDLRLRRADAYLPPRVETATVWASANQAVVRVIGEDVNADAVAAEVTWRGPQGEALAAVEVALSPVPWGSVQFSGQGRLPAAPGGAVGATIRVRDLQDAWGPQIEAEVRPLAELAADAPCDPDATAERCAVDLVCPAVAAPTCRAPSPPTVEEHRASVVGSEAVFELTLGDADGDLAAIDWAPFAADGLLLAQRAPLPLAERWLGAQSQITFARARVPPAARRYQLWVRDAAGLEQVIEGVFDQPQRGRFGDACDPLGLDSQCEPEHYCRATGDEHRCWPADPPQDGAVTAWVNADAGTIGIVATARDAAGIVGIEADGARHLFHAVERRGTQAEGWGAWPIPTPTEVRLVNAHGVMGPPIAIAPQPTPVAPPGGGCDPYAALATCPAGSQCIDDAGDRRFNCQ